MTKGDTYYFSRILKGISYDVLDIKIRTVEDTWFCGIDKRDKQAFLFNNSALGVTVFEDRLEAVNACKVAEEKYGRRSYETERVPTE